MLNCKWFFPPPTKVRGFQNQESYELSNKIFEGLANGKNSFNYKELKPASGFTTNQLDNRLGAMTSRCKLYDFLIIAYCAGYKIKLEPFE